MNAKTTDMKGQMCINSIYIYIYIHIHIYIYIYIHIYMMVSQLD
jgi:hypothetical protein